MAEQKTFSLSTKAAGPVECLGQTFPSEETRREHFLNLLADKLKDPEFRKIEGFPIGKDEDILALSDPPYYTACPNPWIGDFIKAYGTPYDPKKPYHREPFAADVSEGKYHPVYKLHPYPTKVPHRAIMRYLLHYTEPGDVVFDGFAGTGMTGVAAQYCGDPGEVTALGYRIDSKGSILGEDGTVISRLGARRAILQDLSTLAAFIAYSYSTPVDPVDLEIRGKSILRKVDEEYGWMFQTNHGKGLSDGRVNYTVWSDVFVCSQCGADLVFWEVAVDKKKGVVLEEFQCFSCHASLTKRSLEKFFVTQFDPLLNSNITTARQQPVLINYTGPSGRHEKTPDSNDLATLARIESARIPYSIPLLRMPVGDESRRNDPIGISHVHQFYTKRTLACLSAFRQMAAGNRSLLFAVTKLAFQITKLYRFTYMNGVWGAGGGPLSGTLYIPSLSKELNVLKQLVGAIEDRASVPKLIQSPPALISTGSSSSTRLPDSSVDYIFLDPPFGSNLMYSELNFLAESWLNVLTCSDAEAITSESHGKSIHQYRALMLGCFSEAFRVLKPGRWMTVEFSNTQAAIWNLIQSALQEAGFVVANVSALDKKKLAFKAVTSPTAVKQDLVISAYKPNGGLEERFSKSGLSEEGVWDFIRTHLRNLPTVRVRGGEIDVIVERDPRILYDRMVAFYVGHSTPVPLSSGEFQATLADKFPERDGMFFLPEQVNEYDKKRAQIQNVGQLSIFVEDERSAVNWLRRFLKERPSPTNDIQPDFLQQITASWKKWEARPELKALLDQNFLCYDGTGEVPSQIHSYLSTQFKELRNLPKDHPQLQAKAKNRWYVPDPKKNVDVETLRNKRLLEEFWSYLPDGYTPPVMGANAGQALPGFVAPRPKVTKGKKLREIRTEAVRVGFKHCYQQKDYTTILVVADLIPESVLNEDEQLQMIYDTAVTRTGGAE
jgi:DNA modification methylase